MFLLICILEINTEFDVIEWEFNFGIGLFVTNITRY